MGKATRQGRDPLMLVAMELTDGRRPIHGCAETGDFDVCEYLLGMGVDLNPVTNEDGLTPLMVSLTNAIPSLAHSMFVVRCSERSSCCHGVVGRKGC